MSAPLATVHDRTTQVATEQRVMLSPVSWATYESLLADLADQSSIRLAYDQGTLEILSPLPAHPQYNDTVLLTDFLTQCKTLKRMAWLRAIRARVQKTR